MKISVLHRHLWSPNTLRLRFKENCPCVINCYKIPSQPSIHPSVLLSACPIHSCIGSGAFPSSHGARGGYTLNRSPVFPGLTQRDRQFFMLASTPAINLEFGLWTVGVSWNTRREPMEIQRRTCKRRRKVSAGRWFHIHDPPAVR